MASTKSEKELKRNWPNTDGIIAETTTQEGHIMNLEAEECSVIRRDFRAGIY